MEIARRLKLSPYRQSPWLHQNIGMSGCYYPALTCSCFLAELTLRLCLSVSPVLTSGLIKLWFSGESGTDTTFLPGQPGNVRASPLCLRSL